MVLFGGVAVVLFAMWLRGRIYRARFNRAMRTMQRGGMAQRATAAFWKVVAVIVLAEVLRLYLDAHAR